MIVRFNLEDSGQIAADVDRAGVLAGPLQDLRAFGRQRLQVDAGALVAAVLRPHHREDPELGKIRLAAEKPDDPFVFIGGDAVPLEHLRVRHGSPTPAAAAAAVRRAAAPACSLTHAIADSRMPRPSVLPSSASHARSGCGIMPTTLRVSLQTPAIAFTDPFGFAASSTAPAGVT